MALHGLEVERPAEHGLPLRPLVGVQDVENRTVKFVSLPLHLLHVPRLAQSSAEATGTALASIEALPAALATLSSAEALAAAGTALASLARRTIAAPEFFELLTNLLDLLVGQADLMSNFGPAEGHGASLLERKLLIAPVLIGVEDPLDLLLHLSLLTATGYTLAAAESARSTRAALSARTALAAAKSTLSARSALCATEAASGSALSALATLSARSTGAAALPTSTSGTALTTAKATGSRSPLSGTTWASRPATSSLRHGFSELLNLVLRKVKFLLHIGAHQNLGAAHLHAGLARRLLREPALRASRRRTATRGTVLSKRDPDHHGRHRETQ